jgi:hypothetical protein
LKSSGSAPDEAASAVAEDGQPCHVPDREAPMEQADVTVITALYNGEAFLEAAIQSVAEQRLRPKRHLVIDDASTDGSLALARRLAQRFEGVEVIAHPVNRGYPATLNTGIAAADTAYVAILDCDDLALPDWLHTLVPILETDPSLGGAGGGCEIVTEEGEPTGGFSVPDPDPGRLGRGANPFTHSSTVWRREALESVGGYDGTMHGFEDTELFGRIAVAWGLCHAGRVLARYRQRRGSNTSQTRALWPRLRRALRTRHALVQSGLALQQAHAHVLPELEALRSAARRGRSADSEGVYAYTLARAFERGGRFGQAARHYRVAALRGVKPLVSGLGWLRCGARAVWNALRGPGPARDGSDGETDRG